MVDCVVWSVRYAVYGGWNSSNIGFGYSFIILCSIVCLMSCLRESRSFDCRFRQAFSIWMSQVWNVSLLVSKSIVQHWLWLGLAFTSSTLNKQNNDIVYWNKYSQKVKRIGEAYRYHIGGCSGSFRNAPCVFTQTTILFDWQNPCAAPVK